MARKARSGRARARPQARKISIVLADDYTMVRQGLRALPEAKPASPAPAKPLLAGKPRLVTPVVVSQCSRHHRRRSVLVRARLAFNDDLLNEAGRVVAQRVLTAATVDVNEQAAAVSIAPIAGIPADPKSRPQDCRFVYYGNQNGSNVL